MNIINKLSVAILLSISSSALFAQLPEKVGSLIHADKSAANLSASETPHKALSSIIDKTSVFYIPSEVNAFNYLDNRPNIADVMTWEPTLALVARSQNWGLTTGPMEFQKIGAKKRYGEYLTIWKRNKKGLWTIDLRAEVEHFQPTKATELSYKEPDNSWFMKQRSKVRLEQREEVVLESDKVLSTILRADNEAGYREFLKEDARLLFPWQEPVIGKKNIMAALKKQRVQLETTPLKVGRAYSGEYAYSMGTANVAIKDKTFKYNYIRVWELQDDFQWKVIVEMLFER
ncbi:DUF4440 domain-containing protein [Sphingobacteriaceae bacterium WQ 2009]|uniref:DUF4440 domain-containing protein n=1 Tax=Rhinopithecimicrobium faecis TaxID=2820698 RepID=A0A8T4H690_9SPHI|nr:DUF4440 domain-containing protein [Sphingobacteriaceae bacterium WQ 2009]